MKFFSKSFIHAPICPAQKNLEFCRLARRGSKIASVEFQFGIPGSVDDLLLFTLSSTFSNSLIILIVGFVCLSQLFGFCWMGSRVTSRINQLSHSISDVWYLMKPSQRNTLQMVQIGRKTCKHLVESSRMSAWRPFNQ